MRTKKFEFDLEVFRGAEVAASLKFNVAATGVQDTHHPIMIRPFVD
jgi:hypothetical protein